MRPMIQFAIPYCDWIRRRDCDSNPIWKEGMSGAIIGMHVHDETDTTARRKDRQERSITIKTGTSAFKT